MNNSTVDTEKLRFVNAYLARGWALVPLHSIGSNGCTCTRGTERCPSAGKHPIWREWQAPLNLIRDAALWQPQWNVGIATGAPSGHWVLDLDPDHAGSDALGIVADLTSLDNREPHVRTGGGGEHWRFRMPPDFEVTNRRGTLPAGLDVRGTGGQVVAPPSVSGKGAYVELTDAEPYEAPGWLLDMIRPAAPLPRGEPPAGWSSGLTPIEGATAAVIPGDRGQRYATAAVRELLDELAGAPEGVRNSTAFRVACRLIELHNAGWVTGAYAAGSFAEAVEACGLPWAEGNSVWSSAERKIADRPAELPPEWTDPLRVEVWPAPPVTPAGVPPFSPNSNGAALIPGFSEPATLLSGGRENGAGSPRVDQSPTTPDGYPTGTESRFDPQTEIEINRAMRSMVAREQAAERLQRLRGGDRSARLAVLRGRLLTGNQLDDVPPLVPLVDGMLYRDSLARINGLPGQGKSFLALDVGASVATGRAWHGRSVQRAPVVYMVAEGLSGVRARKLAWESRNGSVGGGLLFYAGAEQIAGEDWEIFTALCVEVGAGLVVVDTQARATAGRNENLPADMGPVVAGLDALRVATGACVLLVHHKSKNGEGGRGTNAVEGAMQSEFDVAKNGPTVTLRTTRQKDSDTTLRLALTLAPEGESAVLVLPGESGTANASAIEIGRTRQRALWNFMFQFCNEGDGLSRARIESGMKNDPAFALSTREYPKAFQRGWNGLIKLGLITKHYRRDAFKVVELQDQGEDGVLTPNGTKDGADRWSPSGDWILWTADRESVTKAESDGR